MNEAAVALAYKHCEEITRSRARNFYYGIRLLPPSKRSAMCALYAMARRIDDVGDGIAGPPTPGSPHRPPKVEDDDKLTSLKAVRSSLSLLSGAAGGLPVAAVPPGDPVLIALADATREFALPVDALLELVEGCEWDIAGRRYATFDELVEYCRRVAGSVGRLSLSIYGSSDPAAAGPLADALGVALQLTNILRDLLEDRDVMGRVYVPAEDLDRFGVGPDLDGKPDDVMALICFETGRASAWYEQGLALLPLLDGRSRACTAAMVGIYRRLLDKIRLDPESVLRGRVGLSTGQKAAVAAMALARNVA
ncbi:MAG: phytoene/squalene synthase family protein [Acidimicrobiales bacterium]